MAAGVTTASTTERLRAAGAAGTLTAADAHTLSDAFELIERLRLEHQVAQLRAGVAPDDYVDPGALSSLTRTHLKEAFRAVATIQKGVAAGLGGVTHDRRLARLRPAIWVAMLGAAVMLLVTPFYVGAVLLGFAGGAAIRITQRRHRLAGESITRTSAPRQAALSRMATIAVSARAESAASSPERCTTPAWRRRSSRARRRPR